MKKIFKTQDGWKSDEALMWDFIKSVDMVNEYRLWLNSITTGVIDVA